MLDKREQHKHLSHSLLSLLRTLTQTGAAHNKNTGELGHTAHAPGTERENPLSREMEISVRLDLCTWVG